MVCPPTLPRKHLPPIGEAVCFFFFSSRRRHTRSLCDWSSDVCSSDLELAHDLFGDADPVGKQMLINAMPYTVIGVLEKRLQMGTYGGPDKNHAVIPITTFQAQVGRKYLGNLVVRAADPAMMKTALDEIRKVFAAKYDFDPEDDRVISTWDTVAGQKIM